MTMIGTGGVRIAGSMLLQILPLLAAAGAVFFDVGNGRIPNGWNVLCFLLGAAARAAAGAWASAAGGPAGEAAARLPELAAGGLSGAGAACLASLAVTAALFPLFLFRMTGAGDIKLLAAIAAPAGLSGIGRILTGTVICGGALSFFLMAADDSFSERFRYFFSYLKRTAAVRTVLPYRDAEGPGRSGDGCAGRPPGRSDGMRGGMRGGEFHLTVPILMGVLLWSGGML